MNQLTVLVKESGLEKTKAQVLLDNFKDYFEMASEWEKKAEAIMVTSVKQTGDIKMAREGRLFLRSKRIEVEKTRKVLKEQSLREGKAIDGIANILKALIIPVEEYLKEQEDFAKIEEAKRKKLLAEEREAILIELEVSEFDIAGYDLGNMQDDIFDALVLARETRIKEEAEIERKRIQKEKEDAIEQERIRKENIALKKEAEEKEAERLVEIEKQNKKQQKELEAQKKIQEAKAQKEKEEYEAKMEKQQKELEAQVEKARIEKEEIINNQINISKDGDKFCVLYGENLQDGISGFGNTPKEAITNFCKGWLENFNLNNK